MIPEPCVLIELAIWRMLMVFKCLLFDAVSTKIWNNYKKQSQKRLSMSSCFLAENNETDLRVIILLLMKWKPCFLTWLLRLYRYRETNTWMFRMISKTSRPCTINTVEHFNGDRLHQHIMNFKHLKYVSLHSSSPQNLKPVQFCMRCFSMQMPL